MFGFVSSLFGKKAVKSNVVNMAASSKIVAVRNAHPQREVALATLWVWEDPRIVSKPALADRLSFSDLLSHKEAEAIVFG